MKHAFYREMRFAGHRNAGFAAASRRLTVGRPFKAGTLVPASGSRAASAALESRTPLRFAISSVAPRRGYRVGLRRPALKGRPTLRGRYAAMKMSRLQSPRAEARG